MTRKDFIVDACAACLSVTVIASLLPSCVSTHYISGKLGEDGLTVSKDEFKIRQKENTAYRSFIIVRNEALQFPICVYRFSDQEYSALWMRCTHQGAELQASGDFLQCPAHGSEFNNKGQVTTGPADNSLRSFPVTVSNNEIFIDLRKQS
ncbi:MAG TPA: Rieske 2Fe-2S domain-containing protein [Chitinophagaceae bacterium]